jgi:hypothetical protein
VIAADLIDHDVAAVAFAAIVAHCVAPPPRPVEELRREAAREHTRRLQEERKRLLAQLRSKKVPVPPRARIVTLRELVAADTAAGGTR